MCVGVCECVGVFSVCVCVWGVCVWGVCGVCVCGVCVGCVCVGCVVCVCGVCVQYVLFMSFLFFQRYDLMRGTNRYFVVVCLAARMQGRHPSPEA